ncbi:hypothetical protein Mt3935_13500, partial [Mycobacterium tuberculosis]
MTKPLALGGFRCFAVFLAAGCTTTTTGKAGLAPNAVPRPLMGSLIQRVPLDGAALSTLLNQPFQAFHL